jgi:hypothetical protein
MAIIHYGVTSQKIGRITSVDVYDTQIYQFEIINVLEKCPNVEICCNFLRVILLLRPSLPPPPPLSSLIHR